MKEDSGKGQDKRNSAEAEKEKEKDRKREPWERPPLYPPWWNM